jgi:hypothetical protein
LEHVEKLEKALRSAKASLEIEGLKVEDYHEELVRKKLKGEISEEEFLETAKKIAKQKSDQNK